MSKGIIPAISVYVGLADYNESDNTKYLEKAASLGIRDVFTSFHMPEAINSTHNGMTFGDAFARLTEVIKRLGMRLIVDLSKKAYESFQNSDIDKVFRLDYGFTKEEIVTLSHGKYLIELNASTIKKSYLEELVEMGLNTKNVRMSYNFYPKKYTALSYQEMINRNKWFDEYGLTKMAYISSIAMKRPPIYDGVPSIEETREMPVKYAVELLYMAGIDEVGIGDAYASFEELQALTSFNSELIKLPILLNDEVSSEEKDLLFSVHNSRTDQGEFMIRSSKKSKNPILPSNTKRIEPYDVCIDNELYKRYCGEISIALKKMENEGKVNVVGQIPQYGRMLVDNLKPGTTFEFINEGFLKN